MRLRKYINRIEIWQTAPVYDGFSGNTVSETKISDSWCNVKTIPVDKLEGFGLNEVRKAIIITLRHRNDLDYNNSELFLKYKGDSYEISRVTEKDLDGKEFQIIASA